MTTAMLAGCSKEQAAQPSTESTTKTQSVENNETETETQEADTTSEPTTVDIMPGTSMSEAAELPLNATTTGTVESGQSVWYSFTTGDTEGMTYKVMMENVTSDPDKTHAIYEGHVCDEYGETVGGTSHFVRIEDTAPEVITVEKAKANTTYYISLDVQAFRDDTDFTIVVKPVE